MSSDIIKIDYLRKLSGLKKKLSEKRLHNL